jgi:hypothetical protein
MLRGLQSRLRAPASDELRQSFVRLRQAKAPPDFIAVERYPSSVFFFQLKKKKGGRSVSFGVVLMSIVFA